MTLPSPLYLNGSQYSTQERYIGFRALFGSEGGRVTPDKMPCVIPSLNVAGIDFTQAMQWQSFHLMRSAAPLVDGKHWRAVYGGHRAFTNGQGYDMPGDPRRDYVNGSNLNSPFPKLMKAIICEGNFFRGELDGDELVMTPGVHAIDGNQDMPSVQTILDNHWYFVATTRSGENIGNFPQGFGAPVLIPFILKQEARYEARFFVRWEVDTLPDPLKVYL